MIKELIRCYQILFLKAKNLYITGSGTSYNAARITKYLFSKYAKLKIEPIISSELPFSPDSIEEMILH